MGVDREGPVIIAGAGPVGATLALYLARHGIRVVLLEKEATLPEDLRASTFHPPSLDMLDRLGLSRYLVERGLVFPKFQYHDRPTGQVATFDLSAIADVTAHPYRLQCEQWHLGQACCAELAALPNAEVRFSHQVTGVSQGASGVEVTVESPSAGPRTIRGAYVVGCDGASSAVRRGGTFEFPGFTYPEQFLVISTSYPLETLLPNLCGVDYFADPQEWCTLIRCAGLWRVAFPTKPEDRDEDLLSDEHVQSRFQRLAPKAGDYDVHHRTLYRVHQRVASSYRHGRILIAGDAAHINNPLGGMGMNGGIHDAFNLGEKLVAMHEGAADDSALDVYDRQRRITAQAFVQDQSIRTKKLLEEKDPQAQRRRQAEFMRIAADPAAARAFMLRLSMIDVVRDSYALN